MHRLTKRSSNGKIELVEELDGVDHGTAVMNAINKLASLEDNQDWLDGEYDIH